MTRHAHGKLSNKQYQEKLRQAERRKERQREDDLRELMATDWGRRVAYWIIFHVGRLQDGSFDASKRDGLNTALFTARCEGRRDVAIDIHNEVQRLAPAKVLEMHEEQIRAVQAELALEMETD